MPDHFTDEEVEALKAGLEGVTPGPWYRDGALVYALDDTEVCNRFSAGVQRGWISRGRYDDIHKRTSDEECEATAAHFQRCSPDAIRRLLARLEQAEARVKELQAALKAIAFKRKAGMVPKMVPGLLVEQMEFIALAALKEPKP